MTQALNSVGNPPFDAVARWWAVLDFKGCLEGNQSSQASELS